MEYDPLDLSPPYLKARHSSLSGEGIVVCNPRLIPYNDTTTPPNATIHTTTTTTSQGSFIWSNLIEQSAWELTNLML